MTVTHITPEAHSSWDEYVLAHPQGTAFHLTRWHEILKTLGFEWSGLIATSGGTICGVLPLAQVKSILFGNHLVSLPFCVYGGPLTTTPEAESELLKAAEDLAVEKGVDVLELRNRSPLQKNYPTKDLYYTFRKSIASSDDENLKAIPRKQRAVVRKGMKTGLTSEITTDLDTFYTIYAHSVRNLGTPVFSKKYFSALITAFSDQCNILLVRNPSGEPLAAVLSLYFRDEVLPYYGGSVPAARAAKANDFMYWELMRHAAAQGCTIFDFGRSKENTGPFSFKKNWGFEPQPLAYQYYLNKSEQIPEVNPNNPKYSLFIEAWKRMPVPVANLLGPLISKYLG